MLESASARALQQDAYRAGNEMKQSHVQARCVRQGAAVAVMSADYACVQLFKEQQRCWSIAHLHERAGVRMWAFCQGYQGEALGRIDVTGSVALPALPMHARRKRGMHRHRRQAGA